jgi:hypothetical protein
LNFKSWWAHQIEKRLREIAGAFSFSQTSPDSISNSLTQVSNGGNELSIVAQTVLALSWRSHDTFGLIEGGRWHLTIGFSGIQL